MPWLVEAVLSLFLATGARLFLLAKRSLVFTSYLVKIVLSLQTNVCGHKCTTNNPNMQDLGCKNYEMLAFR